MSWNSLVPDFRLWKVLSCLLGSGVESTHCLLEGQNTFWRDREYRFSSLCSIEQIKHSIALLVFPCLSVSTEVRENHWEMRRK